MYVTVSFSARKSKIELKVAMKTLIGYTQSYLL